MNLLTIDARAVLRARRAHNAILVSRSRCLSVAAVVGLASLLVTLALGAPAQAVLVRTRTGHVVSFQPTVARARTARGLAQGIHLTRRSPGTTSSRTPLRTAGSYTPCLEAEAACLTYYGGPVMRTTTLTPVFWNPAGLGLKYPSGYEEEIEAFLTNLAADSGKATNFFSVLPQYYEKVGLATNHVAYSVTAGPALRDTDALPTALGDTCTSPFGASRPCVQDEGVRAELRALVKSQSLPTGIGHEYVVFFPEGIDSCFNEGGAEDRECSGTGYCGYHGTLNAATSEEVEYANEPDNGDPEYKGGCSGAPKVTAGAATINTTSHEVSESVTDPQVGAPTASWYDQNKLFVENEVEPEYGEIGDMCAWEFLQGSKALGIYSGEGGASEGETNQTINGHHYLLQTEWDNAHSTCSISAEAAAAAVPSAAPSASFVHAPNGVALTGEAVSFDASASTGTISHYEWNWGDGSPAQSGTSPTAEHAYSSTGGALRKTFTVTLTVTDSKGETASVGKAVEVEDRAPIATFAAPTGAIALSPIAFDGTASSDPDGTIASYRWEFGDGSQSSEATPSHAYAQPGNYKVTLTVTDDAGRTASKTEEVSVRDAPPIASFSVLTTSPTAGSPVSFDGSASSDPDGSIASYRWEFGDGGISSEAKPSHTYATAGEYTVKLVVTDEGHEVNSATHTITVAAPVSLVTIDNSGASLGTQPGSGTSPGHGSASTTSSSAPANAIRVVASKQNKMNGTVTLRIAVPGPGKLGLTGAAAHAGKKHTAGGSAVRAEQLDISSAGTVTLQVVPVGVAQAALKHRHKLSVKVLITFSPTGGAPRTIRRSIVLRLGMSHKRK